MTQAELKMENEKLHAEIAKLISESAKLNAETKQVTVMTFIAPFATAAGLIAATATLVKIFFP